MTGHVSDISFPNIYTQVYICQLPLLYNIIGGIQRQTLGENIPDYVIIGFAAASHTTLTSLEVTSYPRRDSVCSETRRVLFMVLRCRDR